MELQQPLDFAPTAGLTPTRPSRGWADGPDASSSNRWLGARFPAVRSNARLPGFALIDEGRVEAEAPIGEYHYNPLGMVHGGVIATLADTCAGCAVQTLLPEGVGYASIDLTIKFLRQVRVGDGPLRVRAGVIHRGRHVATASATVTTVDGHLAATAVSSCLVVDHR